MLLLDLYAALRPLDEITGATTTDDILNLIFSAFCIGKQSGVPYHPKGFAELRTRHSAMGFPHTDFRPPNSFHIRWVHNLGRSDAAGTPDVFPKKALRGIGFSHSGRRKPSSCCVSWVSRTFRGLLRVSGVPGQIPVSGRAELSG